MENFYVHTDKRGIAILGIIVMFPKYYLLFPMMLQWKFKASIYHKRMVLLMNFNS